MKIRSLDSEEKHLLSREKNLPRGEGAVLRQQMLSACEMEEEEASQHLKAEQRRQRKGIRRVNILGLCNRMMTHLSDSVLFQLYDQLYPSSENPMEALAALFILLSFPSAFIIELAVSS